MNYDKKMSFFIRKHSINKFCDNGDLNNIHFMENKFCLHTAAYIRASFGQIEALQAITIPTIYHK